MSVSTGPCRRMREEHVFDVVVEVVAKHKRLTEQRVRFSADILTLGPEAVAVGDSLELVFQPRKPFRFDSSMTVLEVIRYCAWNQGG